MMMVMVMMVVVVVVTMMMVMVMVMVMIGKFHIRIASFRSSETHRGLSGIRSRQEGKRIRDGVKELGIRTRRWQPTRGGHPCRRLRTIERRQSGDHTDHANKLHVHALLLGALSASAQRPIIGKGNLLWTGTQPARVISARAQPAARRVVLMYHRKGPRIQLGLMRSFLVRRVSVSGRRLFHGMAAAALRNAVGRHRRVPPAWEEEAWGHRPVLISRPDETLGAKARDWPKRPH
jgi:hypothetical protein